MTTDYGYETDVSYDTDLGEDVIYVDTGDSGFYLTHRDLVQLGGLIDGN